MLSNTSNENTTKNKQHYDKRYAKIDISKILKIVENVDKYLDEVTVVDTSWVCMYSGNFREEIKGKKILELGCGNCYNAAVMAALGAEVYANDISDKSGAIIEALNAKTNFKYPIKYLKGDFLKIELLPNDFDLVVGKAFLHHLTHEQEREFMKKIVASLRPEGGARFVEPAVNNLILDKLRWMIPVPGRPSSLNIKKFKEWQGNDPHPIRDNSGKHYRALGYNNFKEVKIQSVGSLERFHRLFPKAKWNRKFRSRALKFEKILPKFLQQEFARTQTITYKFPLN